MLIAPTQYVEMHGRISAALGLDRHAILIGIDGDGHGKTVKPMIKASRACQKAETLVGPKNYAVGLEISCPGGAYDWAP
jgi:hypothetical protein